MKIVIGDPNAQVGNEELFRGTTGGQSIHKISNDNGLRIVNFAIEKKMRIMSTYFTRKDTYKGTWLIPGSKETNQIDHILIDEKYANLVTNIRSYRGADANSDHFLIIAKIRKIKLKRQNKNYIKPKPKYNMNDFRRHEIARRYRDNIYKNIDEDNGTEFSNGVDRKWEKIVQIINSSTRKTLTKQGKQQYKLWLDAECLNEIERRKELRGRYLKTGDEQYKKQYQEQKKKTKKLCRNKKRKFKEEEVKIIEDKYKKNDMRIFFKDVNI